MIFTLERRKGPRILPVGEVVYIDDPEFADTMPMDVLPVVAPPAIPGLEVIEIFTDCGNNS